MERKCECCKRRYEAWNKNQRLCGNCRSYINDLKRQLVYYKMRFRQLNKKIYGTEDGRQRIHNDGNKQKRTNML